MAVRIDLASVNFGEKERPLAEAAGFSLSTFRYDSGIAALFPISKPMARSSSIAAPPRLALRAPPTGTPSTVNCRMRPTRRAGL